jgi:hypothetical protein
MEELQIMRAFWIAIAVVIMIGMMEFSIKW